mgnify:CR=1 FL=1
MKDLLIINLKAYQKGIGQSANELIRSLQQLESENIIVCLNPVDTFLAHQTDVTCYAQHADPVEYGSHTGHIVLESLVEYGCKGLIINHSEDTVAPLTVDSLVQKCKNLGVKSIVCVPSVEKVKEYTLFEPDAIAIEPPELIGGDVSVSSAQPELIERAVEESTVPLLCGAGVKTAEDVSKAKSLGAKGVLIASGVVKHDEPIVAVKNLLSGF